MAAQMASRSLMVEPVAPLAARPIRALAVIPGDGRGASLIWARRQVESLRRMEVDVREFYLLTRTAPSALFHEWRRLRQEVAEFRPQIVHAHYGTMTCFLAGLIPGAPLVVSFQGSDLNPHPSVPPWRRAAGLLLSQIGALIARKVICVSAQLREQLWWKREDVTVIPAGIDLELFRPVSKEKARLELGWPPAGKCVLFNAGTEPQGKGLPMVQEALRVAESRVGPVHLWVLDGTVSPGDVPLYLNAADCLAFASRWEGSPNIVKEALACNLPVVSTDVGDVAERLRNVHPSRIVPRDAEAMGQALAEILQLGSRSNGREHVVDLSEERIASRLLRLYREILEGRAAVPHAVEEKEMS